MNNNIIFSRFKISDLISLILIFFLSISFANSIKLKVDIIKPSQFIVTNDKKIVVYDEATHYINEIDIKNNYKKYKLTYFVIDSLLKLNNLIGKDYIVNVDEFYGTNKGKLVSIEYIKKKGVNLKTIESETMPIVDNLIYYNNNLFIHTFAYTQFSVNDNWVSLPQNYIFTYDNNNFKDYLFPNKNTIQKWLGKSPVIIDNKIYFINTFIDEHKNKNINNLIFYYKSGNYDYLKTLNSLKLDFKEFYNYELELISYKNKLLLCSKNNNMIFDVFNNKYFINLGDDLIFNRSYKDDRGNYTNTKAEIYNNNFSSNNKYLFVNQWKKEKGKRISYLKVVKNDRIIQNINFKMINSKIEGIANIFAKEDKLYYLYIDANEDYYIDNIDIDKLIKIK